jgi:hypothetical protein
LKYGPKNLKKKLSVWNEVCRTWKSFENKKQCITDLETLWSGGLGKDFGSVKNEIWRTRKHFKGLK